MSNVPHFDVPRNVWIGATVVNQEEADRDIPKLLATPAAVRFLSIEPPLFPLDHPNRKAAPVSNVTPLKQSGISVEEIEAAALAEVNDELTKSAKSALVAKYRELASARNVVANIERAIEDLKASIKDGSFAPRR